MREITYTVGVDKISPSTVQFAGFAGENCATKLVFAIDGEFWNKISSEQGVSIMLECIDNSGEYDAFVLKQNVVDVPESVTFDIPKEITELGGRVTMQLSFVELDADIKLKRKLFAYPVKLRFAPSTSGGIENTVEYERYHTDVLSAMVRAEQAEAKAKEQAQNAESAATRATTSAQEALDSKNAANQAAQNALNSENAAISAKESAQNAESAAKTHLEDVKTFVSNAENYASSSSASATSAGESADEAKEAAYQASVFDESARQYAESAKDSAEKAKNAIANIPSGSGGSLILTDTSTKENYELQVVDGKLTMQLATESGNGKGKYILIDADDDNKQYTLKVIDGKLTMEVI